MTDETAPGGTTDPSFERLLEHIREVRGFDLTAYKRPSLRRRIDKRLEARGMGSYDEYLDDLQVDPEEYDRLFDYILINVTGFFRDELVWEYLGSEVIPKIADRAAPGGPIRVWSAGCASGEEAYSFAMLLADHLGQADFVDRVKIFGTDLDDDALAMARQAVFDPKRLEAVPERFRETYFEHSNGTVSFRRDLRRSLVFGRHDLVRDTPISRTDLVSCRNTLMYLNAETQQKVAAHFRFSLRPGGFLVLGKSEMLFTKLGSLEPVNLKRRVFTKVGDDPRGKAQELRVPPTDIDLGGSATAALDQSEVAHILVGPDEVVRFISREARKIFDLSDGDVGRPFRDLEVSYRPIELRPAFEESHREGRPVELRGLHATDADGRRITLDIRLTPVRRDNADLGMAISFADVSAHKRLQEELESSNQELETAMEELQASNEELETTNEELQSTNEELETTNEELQSSNEELETMNEELQSTNEELETVNTELHDRTGELGTAESFVRAILGSMKASVIVLDRELRVEVWNRRAEDMWGSREDEVLGTPLADLDVGFPLGPIREGIERSLASGGAHETFAVQATNRRGHQIVCRVTCSELLSDDLHGRVVVLMEEEPPV